MGKVLGISIDVQQVELMTFLKTGIYLFKYLTNKSNYLILVGVVLCQLLNVIRPGIIPKIYSNSTQYFYIENASNFLKTVESCFGVSKTLMFSAPDLAEGKNPRTVCYFVSVRRHIGKRFIN